MTFAEFAEKHNLLIESNYAGIKEKMFVHNVVLTFGKKKYSNVFHKGFAHVGKKVKNSEDVWVWRRLNADELKKYDTRRDYSAFNAARPIPAQMEEFLYSIQLDASCFTNNLTWENFASEFGYNVDSIQEKKIFKACRKTYGELNKFFGHAIFNEFLQCTEDS